MAVASSAAGILTSCYVHTNGTAVTPRYSVVLINNSSSYSYATLNTSGLWSADPLQRNWQVWQTANAGSTTYRLTSIANLQGASLTNQNESISLPPYSLTTAVINNGLASNPTNLLATVTNSGLNVTWPADHWGWILQVQTNALSKGLGTNWADQSNSMYGTSFRLPLGTGNPAVFCRLRHP
jgi:hypothetical protein